MGFYPAKTSKRLAENDVYRRDYIDITNDLLYDDMPYGEAIKAIYELSEFVSGIDWGNCVDLGSLDYSRLFPKSAEDLEAMLAVSEATPIAGCSTMEDGAAEVARRLGL